MEIVLHGVVRFEESICSPEDRERRSMRWPDSDDHGSLKRALRGWSWVWHCEEVQLLETCDVRTRVEMSLEGMQND